MRKAIDETNRRRAVQEVYNREHGIVPQTIKKAIADPLVAACEGDYVDVEATAVGVDGVPADAAALAARERAAEIRDRIRTLEREAVGLRPDA
jgi:excinuclease ABC subunit B